MQSILRETFQTSIISIPSHFLAPVVENNAVRAQISSIHSTVLYKLHSTPSWRHIYYLYGLRPMSHSLYFHLLQLFGRSCGANGRLSLSSWEYPSSQIIREHELNLPLSWSWQQPLTSYLFAPSSLSVWFFPSQRQNKDSCSPMEITPCTRIRGYTVASREMFSMQVTQMSISKNLWRSVIAELLGSAQPRYLVWVNDAWRSLY